MSCACASIAASGSNGLRRPYAAAVAGMNCAIPLAPAVDTAVGLKLDSARSCAANKLLGTFQRDEARAIASRYRAGTNEGSGAAAPPPSDASGRLPAAEQGAGPRV